jgi:broad specificity phosphatase PhoE
MAQSKFCSLLLIKAGPNEWDRSGRLSGTADLPLVQGTAARYEQLGTHYGGTLAAMISGPEQGCIEIARAFAPRRKPRVEDQLHEVGLGLWQGMAEEDVEQRFSSCFRDWKINPGSVSIPEAESFVDAQKRLATAMAKPATKYAADAKHVAFVLRPLACALMRCWLEGREMTDFWEVYDSSSGPEGDVTPILVESTRLKDLPAASGMPTRARKS